MAVTLGEQGEIDVADPGIYVHGPPHELFARLRHEDPVHWNADPDGGFWAVTRYDDVLTVSKTPRVFSSHLGGSQLHVLPPERLAVSRQMMLHMDNPEHAALRRLVSKGFTPHEVVRLTAHIDDAVDAIVERAVARRDCDVVRDLASELPLQVIAEMLGVPPHERARFFDWSNRIVAPLDPDHGGSIEVTWTARMELVAYAEQLAERRIADPGDDLVTILVAAEIDEERLTIDQIGQFVLLLAVAGNETTRNLISGGLLAVLETDGAWDRLRSDAAVVAPAVEEMLRWVSPVNQFRRTATVDTELAGRPIAAGDRVVVFYSSANRDEAHFDHASTFDVGRSPNDHLAFGFGPHFCLGAQLARLEAQRVLTALARHAAQIERTGPVASVQSNFVNGLKLFPVRITPA
jgi:cholest-4-en-3-one 26-monooxygenase